MAGCDEQPDLTPRRVNRAPETSERGAPAGGNLFYHSNRDERRAMRVDAPFQSSPGWLRGNRAMIILLIDVGIVVLLAFIYLFFIQPAGTRAVVDGYRFDGRAFRFEGQLYVTVVATPTTEIGANPPPVIGAAFEDAAARPAIQDLAPAARGARRELPLVGADRGQDQVMIRVWVGEASATFATPIRR